MKKNKDINVFFDMADLIKDYDYDKLFNKLIYNNVLVDNLKDKEILSSLFQKIEFDGKKIVQDSIIIEHGIDISDDLLMEISFFVKVENVDSVICDLICYLKKKKLKYNIAINVKSEMCYFTINLLDREYLVKLVDYINLRLGKNIEELFPLVFGDDKVGLSFLMDYSYNEILVMFLDKFLKSEKIISYSNFKKFILDNYFKITNQVDMADFIKYNKKDIQLSKFYKNIEFMITLIVYLINGKDMEDYYDYFKKIKKDEKKNINLYSEYDQLEDNDILFNELVNVMFNKYGLEYTKDSIINYINTGKRGYITRVNDLRKRVFESKTFRIFLMKIDFDTEFEKIVVRCNLEKKKTILENVCKETYKTCNDLEKCNSGKIQVARTLIRISIGDYSSITRHNNARSIAKENIMPSEVVNLIKETLKIDYVKKEATLYELYADYIVNLCLS